MRNYMAGIVAAVASCHAVQSLSYAAEPGNPIPITQPTESQIAECREWAAHYWAWRDSGQIPPGSDEFSFSFTVGSGFNPFQPTVVLFTQLYANQLSVDYTIWDLIEDDPEVFAAFRHHSLTGELTTSLASPATIEHLNMIAQAMSGSTTVLECEIIEYQFADGDVNVSVEGDALVSTVTSKKKIIPCPPGPGPTNPDPFRDILRDKMNESRLPWSDCYQDDSWWPWGTPGFDCDDYAEAMRNYLRNKLIGDYPNIDVYYLWVTWWREGHAMVVVEIDGKFYLVDPQTGTLMGPYTTWEQLVAAAWQIMSEQYGVEDPWFPDATKSRTPRPWNEPGPWHTDPDRRQQIKDCLGIDDDTPYIWN